MHPTCVVSSHKPREVTVWESPKLHYFYKCKEGCEKLGNGRFKHEWILDRDVAYCEKTGLWWLVYEEGNGMFCLLCRMHDCENPFNHKRSLTRSLPYDSKRVCCLEKIDAARNNMRWPSRGSIISGCHTFTMSSKPSNRQKIQCCTLLSCQYIGWLEKQLRIVSSSLLLPNILWLCISFLVLKDSLF